jgi:hypothetical protein
LAGGLCDRFDRQQLAAKLAVAAVAFRRHARSPGGFEPGSDGVSIWLPKPALDALTAMREPRESYSDVILQLASMEADA